MNTQSDSPAPKSPPSGHRRVLEAVALTSLLLCFGTAAHAEQYLDIPEIPGESTATNHEGEIDVMAWNWGAKVNADSTTSGRTRSHTCVSDLEIVKISDSTSPSLLLLQLTGQSIPEMTLTVTGYTEEGLQADTMELKLSHVVVTGFRAGAMEATTGDGGAVREKVTFAFEELEFNAISGDYTNSASYSITTSGRTGTC